LVRGGVLAAAEQLACGDLVENCGQFVSSRLCAHEIVFELLRRVLKLAEIVTNQRDLMCAGQRDGVRDLHRGVLTLKDAPGCRWQSTEVGLARTLKWKRRFGVLRS